MSQRITMSKIAKECNTSIGTVDRALNGRPGINPKTKQLILDTCKRLGYQPNYLAGALSRKKQYRIAMIYCKEQTDFYHYVTQGIEKAKAELVDYGLTLDLYQSTHLSEEEQYELCQSIDVDAYDGFAINCAGGKTEAWIDSLIDLGKAVITFNTDAPTTKRLFFIGTNPGQAGKLGAEFIGKLLNASGQMAVLGSSLTTNSFEERYLGFEEVMKKEYPSILVYSYRKCFDDEQHAKEATLEILTDHPDIQLLYVTGCAGTIGAMEAMKEANRNDIRLIGYDLTSRISEGIREGYCTAILFQNPFLQGYYAASLLARHLLENWTPKQPLLYIETQIMMKYNLEEYGNQSFHDHLL